MYTRSNLLQRWSYTMWFCLTSPWPHVETCLGGCADRCTWYITRIPKFQMWYACTALLVALVCVYTSHIITRNDKSTSNILNKACRRCVCVYLILDTMLLTVQKCARACLTVKAMCTGSPFTTPDQGDICST